MICTHDVLNTVYTQHLLCPVDKLFYVDKLKIKMIALKKVKYRTQYRGRTDDLGVISTTL